MMTDLYISRIYAHLLQSREHKVEVYSNLLNKKWRRNMERKEFNLLQARK